jgi:hypothetical protein
MGLCEHGRRKYPNAEREWAWQWVFPQQKRWCDKESGVQG